MCPHNRKVIITLDEPVPTDVNIGGRKFIELLVCADCGCMLGGQSPLESIYPHSDDLIKLIREEQIAIEARLTFIKKRLYSSV